MKILIVEPGRHPKKKEIPHTLRDMQETVGGYIQAIYPWDDPVALVCDEEALFKDSEWNRYICEGVAIIDFVDAAEKYSGYDVSEIRREIQRKSDWFDEKYGKE